MTKATSRKRQTAAGTGGYDSVLSGMVELLAAARRASARTVNAIMTATYWEMGRRIVEFEQGGSLRADYGERLLKRLSADLTARFGRGFGYAQVRLMRQFFLSYPQVHQSVIGDLNSSPGTQRIGQSAIGQFQQTGHPAEILQSPIVESAPTVRTAAIPESAIGELPHVVGAGDILQPVIEGSSKTVVGRLLCLANRFPLSWTHYTRLLRVENPLAREFYQAEALRGGWSVRQLERQIGTQFYERTALSSNKVAMLRKGEKPRPEDAVSADEEIRNPLVLEFLGLKDEYSETELEDALIRHLETFLLELGGDFAFVGRQKRLRIDHEWFRIDLLFFHRRLRSLVVIDLKTGPLSHADIGQMHLYLNYTRAHWVQSGENPPIGLILCTEHGESLARYALEGLPNKMLIREYRTALPSEKLLAAELTKARKALERAKRGGP
jgi:predicted nuclease of restriction endonuclease-like (RecB) superfamily